MAQVFDGITVLDFTSGRAGGVATMVMSDFGAEVIKIEPPGGEKFRDAPGSIQWNRGKKSVVLDLKTPDGRERAIVLGQHADVVVENFRPGVAQRLGIDYDSLRDVHPELVYASLTSFGTRGPYAHYKGYDAVVAAKSGRMMMFANQNPRTGPNYVVTQGVCHAAATALVRGITAALYLRERTGRGQHVETSMLQAVTTYDHVSWVHGQMVQNRPGEYPPDPLVGTGRGNPTGYLPVRTKDGQWMQLGNVVERLFRSMMHSLDMDFIYEDPQLKNAPYLDPDAVEALERIMLEKVQQRTLDEWMSIFLSREGNAAAEPYLSSEQALDHPQIVAITATSATWTFLESATPRQLGPVVNMSATPGNPQSQAPTLGQHTREVLARLGNGAKGTPTAPQVRCHRGPWKESPSGPGHGDQRPIGLRVGGRTWRSRHPHRGPRRRLGPDGAALFGSPHHGRIRVHLPRPQDPEGQEIMGKLAAKADLLLHSMRPGAPERTGIGYEQLREINSHLVYLYAGGTGPPVPTLPSIHGADRRGVSGGGVAQMGRDAFPPPEQPMSIDEIAAVAKQLKRANDGTADHSTAMVNAVGLVLGLYARERTGEAQYVESTMINANAYLNIDDFYWHEGKQPRPLPDPEGYGLHALYRLYRAKSGWVFLACLFDEEWQALCRAIDRPDCWTTPALSPARPGRRTTTPWQTNWPRCSLQRKRCTGRGC